LAVKTAIVRPMQNIYKVQYKCALYGMHRCKFCIGLMMAILQLKHVALM